MRYSLGQDEQGRAYVISDPMAQLTQALARQHAGDAAATVAALSGLVTIWGDVLPRNPVWLSQVTRHLHAIQTHGMLAAVAQLPSTAPPSVAP
jgi:fructuronate reductase